MCGFLFASCAVSIILHAAYPSKEVSNFLAITSLFSSLKLLCFVGRENNSSEYSVGSDMIIVEKVL